MSRKLLERGALANFIFVTIMINQMSVYCIQGTDSYIIIFKFIILLALNVVSLCFIYNCWILEIFVWLVEIIHSSMMFIGSDQRASVFCQFEIILWHLKYIWINCMFQNWRSRQTICMLYNLCSHYQVDDRPSFYKN